jgi:hypothetical protein
MIINNIKTAINRHLRTLFSISILLFISFSIISGQDAKEEKFPFDQKDNNGAPSFKDRLFYGGSLGLQLGTITDIQVSPVIGYWVLPRLAVAIGPTYRYYKDPSSATAIYGAKGYIQFAVVQDLSSVIPVGGHTGIFLHIEDELLSLNSYFWKWQYGIPFDSERFYLNTILVGGGISQHLGRRSTIDFMVLWPLDNPYSLYSNPEIRISFIY